MSDSTPYWILVGCLFLFFLGLIVYLFIMFQRKVRTSGATMRQKEYEEAQADLAESKKKGEEAAQAWKEKMKEETRRRFGGKNPYNFEWEKSV